MDPVRPGRVLFYPIDVSPLHDGAGVSMGATALTAGSLLQVKGLAGVPLNLSDYDVCD